MPGRIARTFNRIGGSLMARTGRIGILTATGARSGAKRSVPLGYVKRPDGTLLIGAGSQEPRGWVANLTADPVVTFAIKGAAVRYRAVPVGADARDAALAELRSSMGRMGERAQWADLFVLVPEA